MDRFACCRRCALPLKQVSLVLFLALAAAANAQQQLALADVPLKEVVVTATRSPQLAEVKVTAEGGSERPSEQTCACPTPRSRRRLPPSVGNASSNWRLRKQPAGGMFHSPEFNLYGVGFS